MIIRGVRFVIEQISGWHHSGDRSVDSSKYNHMRETEGGEGEELTLNLYPVDQIFFFCTVPHATEHSVWRSVIFGMVQTS